MSVWCVYVRHAVLRKSTSLKQIVCQLAHGREGVTLLWQSLLPSCSARPWPLLPVRGRKIHLSLQARFSNTHFSAYHRSVSCQASATSLSNASVAPARTDGMSTPQRCQDGLHPSVHRTGGGGADLCVARGSLSCHAHEMHLIKEAVSLWTRPPALHLCTGP